MTHSLETYRKSVQITLVAVLIAMIAALIAPSASAQNSPSHGYIRTIMDGQWRVSFVPVPDVLRMHVEGLPSEGGMLIQQIDEESAAKQLGLQVGDILLEVNGIRMNSPADLPVLVLGTRVVALHRGQIHTRSMPMACNYPIPRPVAGGVTATSVAHGNESVSVRSIGNQKTVEVAMPALHDTMLRIQGTQGRIMNQISNAGLPAETTQRVLRSVGGIR